MNIKTIEEAKKYIGKCVYTAHDFKAKRSNGKNKVSPLYIGGVHLFYNQVDYEIIGFELYENEKYTRGWGKVELDRIGDEFKGVDFSKSYYFMKAEAEKYCEWLNKDEEEREKIRAINTAKELLEEHKVKFEIFV